MRGTDTNLLVRFFAQDDPAQGALVEALFAETESAGERLHVSTPVLCELVWTLRIAPFHWTREQLLVGLTVLLDIPLFEVQDRELVRRAVADYQRGPADFADYLLGHQNEAAGCTDTVTFDRKLRGHPLFTVLRTAPPAAPQSG